LDCNPGIRYRGNFPVYMVVLNVRLLALHATIRAGVLALILAFAFPAVLLASAPAQAQGCNAPGADVVSTVTLPGSPFSVVPTKDGCTIFVSMISKQDRIMPGHIAVLSRAAG
jgi:hypothetical protein